ncbi:hypothetical protein BFP72_17840 [Reichenbachiella sp. 5M10]|uniref:HAD family hydrolase n=1 Tax=Reichenbachiella sp. 5M10 TaxID=1889772 RepID=UPI000C3A07C7|nr:HAD hydrolase-like protein [Reichenbachiella sp. 5M10]PIB37134.1 hypothetical protein BFP72_17840 [Reichenbachiella sp. 5M10]
MLNINCYNLIIWDFDGVILDSNDIRIEGFRFIFRAFDVDQVEKLISYHQENGGLSRYNKIQYFFNDILFKDISENEVLEYAKKFSNFVTKKLTNPNLLIGDSVSFIRNNSVNIEMHVASGSDHEELSNLCNALGLTSHFKSINGSPTVKNELVAQILSSYNDELSRVLLIGDSINDYTAAVTNRIHFAGFNNPELKNLSNEKAVFYIEGFNYFEKGQ